MTSTQPDRIAVRGLTAHAHHGVYGFEREKGQTFSVDAVLELDTAPAAAGDDLTRTVNYAELAQRLHAVLTGDPVDDAYADQVLESVVLPLVRRVLRRGWRIGLSGGTDLPHQGARRTAR